MRITLRYGVTKLENVEVEHDSTVEDLVDQFGTALGLPESVESLVNGSTVDLDSEVSDGDIVTFEKTACRKA